MQEQFPGSAPATSFSAGCAARLRATFQLPPMCTITRCVGSTGETDLVVQASGTALFHGLLNVRRPPRCNPCDNGSGAVPVAGRVALGSISKSSLQIDMSLSTSGGVIVCDLVAIAPARGHPMKPIVIDCFFHLLWFNASRILVLNRRGLHD